MIANFLFIGLPYMALFVFIVGSIFRVYNYGYSVTSHSSQFLETKQLYWGSRFFHFGIIAIIVGHLIGFLFPQIIVALTRHPIALEIAETIAASFGLLALIGIVILIIRRIRFKRLHGVTSSMDIVVYLVVIIQILVGLLIAYYNRWGLSWYASSLVPYLRSLCVFMPDTKVIATMPILIQIHTVSAFVFILLIPFTRLIHFMVYPFEYFYRSYIVVIWNRDMKAMRSSTNTREGKKPISN